MVAALASLLVALEVAYMILPLASVPHVLLSEFSYAGGKREVLDLSRDVFAYLVL